MSDLTHKLTKIAQSIFLGDAQVSKYEIDVSEVKVFKVIKQDVDSDGIEEICFVAGIPDVWDTATCCLLDFHNDGERVIELVPIADGFRDLQVLDINQDGILEIVTWWQGGSGAYLSLYIFQWDGNGLSSLFPETEPFHQGFIETRDLDADGVDELVIWEGLWDMEAQWEQQYFDIHVFRYNGCSYELQTTQSSERCYQPSRIVSREVSVIGTQPDVAHRFTPLENYQQQLETLIQNQQVNEEFIAELTEHQAVLQDETFYEESLASAALALEASEYLSDPIAKVRCSVLLWRDKGATCSFLGDYTQAINCYLQALSLWNESINAFVPAHYHSAFYRELGTMYSIVGNYERALTSLSTARKLLETLDLSVSGNQEELSRLYSNFGLTYARLGEPELAIASFEQAITLDEEISNNFGSVINYMGIGNVQRTTKRYEEAIKSYRAALAAMDEVSDRDRESDVYLELGSTLILTRQLEEGLQALHQALLLTSTGNLKQREAIHYVYLGEAYRELGNLEFGVRFFQKAIAFAQEFDTPETKWQALYGLALTYQRQGQQQRCQQALEDAINTIEQLRSQYLPETFKISLFTDKVKPYEVMLLLHRPTSPEQAFDYMERAKSRVFIEQLATTAVASAAGIPSELAERETQLIGELRRLQLRHRETLSQQKYEWGDEIAQIESQLEDLWHEIRSTGSKGVEYVALRQATPLNFTGVKQILESFRNLEI